MSLRCTWRNTFITALNVPSPAGNIKWLAMWSARKITMRASADTPWATRSGAGTGRGATTAGTPLSERSSSASAIVQHGENDAEKDEQGWCRDSKQGRAFCAQLRHSRMADLREGHRGEHSDQRHREGQRKAHRRAQPRPCKRARVAL